MAGLFKNDSDDNCLLLDPGAGTGSLTQAFLDRCTSKELNFRKIEVHAFEIDDKLIPQLNTNLNKYENFLNLIPKIKNEDFIFAAADSILGSAFVEILPKFTHCILNPPYKKIRNDSAYRNILRKTGIETVNLYSAFVALALSLLKDNGELVAIIPRSFCNGPYYKNFRKYILDRSAIKHIHLFESRTKAFKDDDVLQENIIISLVRNIHQGEVTVTTSTDGQFSNNSTFKYLPNRIIQDDEDQLIHIPTSDVNDVLTDSNYINYDLENLGIQVSTGPVIDFRIKEQLREMPEQDTVPLLYPGHFKSWRPVWPQKDLRKPNAVKRNNITNKWLFPNGYYCIVRRFSSKEEKRRIVASVVEPEDFAGEEMLGFENHLNVYHISKHGLSKELAYGLAVYLNSTAVDKHFRIFNGHTQVNATDLRLIKYPDKEKLIELGRQFLFSNDFEQKAIDEQLKNLIL